MGESVQVRCPECLRTQRYAAPAYPCACGTPIAPPLIPDATAEPVTHRNGADEWVTVLCAVCDRTSDWPHPELGCACGAVLRLAVRPVTGEGLPGPRPGAGGGSAGGGAVAAAEAPTEAPAGPDTGRGMDAGIDPGMDMGTDPGRNMGVARDADAGMDMGPGAGAGAGADTEREARETRIATGAHADFSTDLHTDPDSYPSFTQRHPSPPTPPHRSQPLSSPVPARPAFRPVTIRTARDAVAASAGYLRWLGFRDVVQPEERSAVAVDLRGPGLVAQVDPSTRPTGLRAVECLWLNGLSNGATSVCFSLAGYTPEAHERAEGLGIPLFVLDLTGTPQPVNAPADTLVDAGAP